VSRGWGKYGGVYRDFSFLDGNFASPKVSKVSTGLAGQRPYGAKEARNDEENHYGKAKLVHRK